MRRLLLQRVAFTLVELLVGIGIITVLISILIPALSAARERANRVKCMSNLRQIGQAIFMYMSDNRNNYPRGHYQASSAGGQRIFDYPAVADPFGLAGPINDRTAGYFLLIRYKLVTPAVFVCPSTDDRPDSLGGKPPNMRSNFEDPIGKTLSYSFISPYLAVDGIRRGVRLPPKTKADYAIAADRNDAPDRHRSATPDATRADLRFMNSQSHDGAGQNVLYAAGHVLWSDTPFCGMERDNIYTSQGDSPKGRDVAAEAVTPSDTTLTPWYEDGELEGGGIQPKPWPRS